MKDLFWYIPYGCRRKDDLIFLFPCLSINTRNIYWYYDNNASDVVDQLKYFEKLFSEENWVIRLW